MAETKKSCIGEDVSMEFTKEEIEEEAFCIYAFRGGHLNPDGSIPKEYYKEARKILEEKEARKNLPELTYEDYKPVLDVLDKYWDGQ